MLEKPGRKKGFDPKERKSKDNANLRKIMSASSDKSSRKAAPLIKALANRKVRRNDRMSLNEATEDHADQIKLELRDRDQHWGSIVASEHRKQRADHHEHLRKHGGLAQARRAYWAELATTGSESLRRLAQAQVNQYDELLEQKKK